MSEHMAENGALPWRCDTHGVLTLGDCPRCDEEIIALSAEFAFKALADPTIPPAGGAS